jgi:HPt (histidine-containing phosphotransfer) domain-containing protein
MRSGAENPGFSDYLTKPIEPSVLYATLMRHFNPQHQATAADTPSIPDLDLSTSTDLPGINVPQALIMTNGRIDLVTIRLCQFVEDIHGLDEQLSQCQAQSRHEEVRALVHKLKGASGNIGAVTLHELTTAFFKTTDEQARSILIEKIIGEIHLLNTTEQIVRHRQKDQSAEPEGSAPSSENWKILGTLIEHHAYVPEELLDKLEATLKDSDKRAIMSEIRQELARFRYESADALFKKLRKFEAISDAS